MNLNHLRWVLEVEKAGSFTAAANNLFIAQSNLSNAVKALETELGFPIFSRSARGAQPTPMGKEFIEYARAGIYHLEELKTVFGKHVLSIAQHRHCTFVSHAIARTLQSDSHTFRKFYIHECSQTGVLDSVFSGESMFGVMFYLTEGEDRYRQQLLSRNLSQTVFLECDLTVLVREGHPLLDLNEPTEQDLYRYPPISFIENESRDSTLTAQAIAAGFEDVDQFSAGVFVSDRASLYDILATSDSIFFTGLVNKQDLKRYRLRPISFSHITRKYSIITSNTIAIPSSCNHLINEIKRSAKELL